MKRDQALKTVVSLMLALLELTTTAKCEDKVLRFIVHGPVLTVVNQGRVQIVVPVDDGMHELVLGDPKSSPDHESAGDACHMTYQIVLKGLPESYAIKTSVAPAFRRGNVVFDHRRQDVDFEQIEKRINEGRKNGAYFIIIDAPAAPRVIDALGAAYPVRFGSNPLKDVYVPLTQVLEFPVDDIRKVKLVKTEFKDCGHNQHSRKPVELRALSCQDFRAKYEGYFETTPDPSPEEESERADIGHELARCSGSTFYFFMGVGLPPGTPHSTLESHGRRFFNEKLLPEVFGKGKVPPGAKLVVKQQGGPGYSTERLMRSPMLVPAVYRVPSMQRLFMPALYATTENCTAPGAIVK
jgi:hypothetical protein